MFSFALHESRPILCLIPTVSTRGHLVAADFRDALNVSRHPRSCIVSFCKSHSEKRGLRVHAVGRCAGGQMFRRMESQV